ncbi:MAG: polyphosphate kinase 1, partial [bacterium]
NGFFSLAMLPGFNLLRNKPWDPQSPPLASTGESIFSTLARQDLLLAHPYDSFDPVLRLVSEAADDSDVLAIKQILYRTSRNSPIVAALARAAEQGKNVTAIVELKARFDEERNIEWAHALEQAGVQVVYGIKGLKTHAKLCLVIRREASGICRYMHFGTGNYNEITARLYTDISLLTANPDLAADASLFFNTITGYAQPSRYRKLAAAPLTLRERLLELIDGEIQRVGQGQPARIQAKLNSLVDPELIKALYAASQSGVQVDLNVRGVCCLRPGVPGLSEHIRVVSIVDRFLEHSRILCVEHGGDPQWFISSADWMPRNLDRRIELLVPVEDPACRQRLRFLMDACLNDTVKGRRLQADGRSTRAYAPAAEPRRAQETLWHDAVAQARATEESEKGNFKPLRPANAKRSAQ